MGSRAALLQGFSVAHLCSTIPVSDSEIKCREGPGHTDGLPPILQAAALVGGFILLGEGWLFVGDLPLLLSQTPLGFTTRLLITTSLVVLPVLVGRTFGGAAVTRWPGSRRVWARFWRGRIGSWIMRASGIGLAKVRQRRPVDRPTEVLVARAVADLFEALPSEYKSRMEEVPELASRLEAAAEELRAREAELGRALGTVGTVESSVVGRVWNGPGSVDLEGLDSVQAHRAKAAEDLSAAQKVVGSRLSATMAALENLRLGLLRLQAGVGSPDELTADLKVAREVGDQVRGLLDGEREVESSLRVTSHDEDSKGRGDDFPARELAQ